MTKPWDSKGYKPKSSTGLDRSTARQAKAMLKHGFVVWARSINPNAPKGKIKRPSMKWIRDNISSAQAGLILRTLGYQREPSKEIERRTFMGVTYDSHYDHAMAVKKYHSNK